MMGSAHPAGPTAAAADWITINGVDVNMTQVASILWNPNNNNVLAHVRMSGDDMRAGQENVTIFVVTDAATADELRAYVAAHRPLGQGQGQDQGRP